MRRADFERFTEGLLETLQAEPKVLSLVVLGSMADMSRWDEYSDHDFWVITQNGFEADLLSDLSWLPEHDLLFTLRPAHNYYTVVYQSGHVVEFAVLDLDHLEKAKTNRYRILFDKADVLSRIEAIYQSADQVIRADLQDVTVRYLLLYLLVGAQRFARGELLSAHNYIFGYALNALLNLMQNTSTACIEVRDSFDPRRRFEKLHPDLAETMSDLLMLNIPSAMERMLYVADEQMRGTPNYPIEAVNTIRNHIRHLHDSIVQTPI